MNETQSDKILGLGVGAWFALGICMMIAGFQYALSIGWWAVILGFLFPPAGFVFGVLGIIQWLS